MNKVQGAVRSLTTFHLRYGRLFDVDVIRLVTTPASIATVAANLLKFVAFAMSICSIF